MALIIGLDDAKQPVAETCRRAGDAASRLGIERPSYVHVRRIVLYERRRRRLIGETRSTAVANLLAGRVPDPYRVLGELRDAGRRGGKTL